MLTQYLRQPENISSMFDPPCAIFEDLKRPLCIIELGSGTGYVGINLFKNLLLLNRSYDDIVVLTDLPDVCSLLKDNARNEIQKWPSIAKSANSKLNNLIVQPLPWGTKEAAFTLADVLGLTLESGQPDGDKQKFVTHVICSDLVSSAVYSFCHKSVF